MKLLQPAVAALLVAQAAASLAGNDADVHKRALLGLDAIWANVVKQSGADLKTLCQGVLVKTSVTQTTTTTETIVGSTTTTTVGGSPTRLARSRRAATPAGTAVFNALYQLAPALVIAQCRGLGVKPATTTVATVTKTTQTTTHPTATASLVANGDFSDGVSGWEVARFSGFEAGTDADPTHGGIATISQDNLRFTFSSSLNIRDVAVQPNTNYTLAFDLRNSGSPDPSKYLYAQINVIEPFAELGTLFAYDNPGWNTWTTLEIPFNSGSTSNIYIRFDVLLASSFDNVRLVYK